MHLTPFKLEKFPILTLLENDDGATQTPHQSIFQLTKNDTQLQGTIPSLEAISITLFQQEDLTRGTVTLCHAPTDTLQIPVIQGRTPVWINLSNFQKDKITICHIPIDDRPIESFGEVVTNSFTGSKSEQIETILNGGLHLLVIDFTRKRPPGTHRFHSARDLWKHKAANDIRPLEIYSLAA